MQQHGLQPEEVMLVGDRLHADIRMAIAAGTYSALTLTGDSNETQAQELPLEERPSCVVQDLAELSLCLVNAIEKVSKS